ncbi:MAG: putative Glycosyl transferase group 1 [Capsulimonas sp.]|nr:putative Glycosyl transferase group 1 [Capsulimonas sp.]
MLELDYHAVPNRSRNAAPPLRVAFATESYALGGVERWLAMLIGGLDRSRFTPLLICSDAPDIDPFVADVQACGAEIIRTGLMTPWSPSVSPQIVTQLAWMLKARRIDVLHAQVLGGVGARSIVLAARLAGVKSVFITIHGSQRTRLGRAARDAGRVFDRAFVTGFTTSSHSSRTSQIAMAGRAPDQIRVICHAIECEAFNPHLDREESRRMLGLPEGVPLVGIVGRMDPQKGVDDFLRMARLIADAAPKTHFLLVGDGQSLPQYKALASALGIADRAHFPGRRTDIPRCLAAMDVFVLSSVFEPFGLVLAEAMAMEKPVVATDSGGVSEVIADGVTGALVPISDAPAMAMAALRYLRQPDLARRHGEAGRRRVLEKFTAARMVGEMETMYARSHAANKSHPKIGHVRRQIRTD